MERLKYINSFEQSGRMINFDILRIISTFAVILLHVNAFFYRENIIHDNIYLVQCAINYLTRFSVPCFVMISGAFILDNPKTQNCCAFYKKTIQKIMIPWLVIFIFWIIFLIVRSLYIKNYSIVFISVITCSVGNLWFMPMLFGLYLLAPFVSKILQKMEWREQKKLAIILLIWAMGSAWTSEYKVPYTIGCIFSFLSYFILGFVLKKSIYKINFSRNIFLMLSVMVLTIILRIHGFKNFEFDPYKSFFSPMVIIYSVFIFLMFKNIHIKRNLFLDANKMYYIYLIHTPVYKVLLKIFDGIFNDMVLLMIFLITIFTFVFSYIGAHYLIYMIEKFKKIFSLVLKLKKQMPFT